MGDIIEDSESDTGGRSIRYFMPPEWHRHEMTIMTWPDNRQTWPGERLNRAEHVYADILEALISHEKVLLMVPHEQAQQAAASLIQNRYMDWNRIRMVRMPVNDVWVRDYGPITLLKSDDSRQQYVLSNWEYNAWGGKYKPYDLDNAVPGKLAKLLDYEEIKPGMVLEGGSIDVNGAGCLLTTESVLLNPNRNPGRTKEDIENSLKRYLGIEKVIWLKRGLKGDDTDGHIDDLARFVSERTIVAAVCHDPGNPNFQTLKENLKILRQATDVSGQPFEIIELPLPETRIEGTTVDGSGHVPASYTNFYIANGCILIPMYDERYDHEVLKLFQTLFPCRYMKGIPCTDLVWGQGAIHCITQQLY